MNKYAERKLLRIKMGETEFTFRPSSLRRLLANNEISPAMYEAVTARDEGVTISNHELYVARVADIRAFESLLICDCSVNPKIVPFEPEPDSDALWIEYFTEIERAKLIKALAEYINCEPQDIEVVAPFRDDPHADDPGAGTTNDTGGTDE